MRLLHIDSSARFQGSSSRALSAYFVEAMKSAVPGLIVERIDVAAHPLPHVSEAFTAATYTPDAKRTPAMREVLRESDALVDCLLTADALVFGVPMYNFGMPSALKAFVDHIVRGGRTYVWGPENTIIGQLSGKRALFITTRGADLGPGSGQESFDALTPSLQIAFGFIGLTNVEFVNVQPLQFLGEARKQAALSEARVVLHHTAQRWALEQSQLREYQS